MMPDFIPRANNACLSWSQNFARCVGEQYERYGVSASDAAEVVATQLEFARQHQAAQSPTSDSTYTFSLKRKARKAMERAIRNVAGQVRVRLQLTDRVKLIELGLDTGPGRHARRRKIQAPKSEPIVFIRKNQGARVTITLRDTLQGGRGKPRDVDRAVIFTLVAPQISYDPSAWRFHKLASRTTTTLNFGDDFAPGSMVWIAAYWESKTGKRGKFGRAVYTRLHYPEMQIPDLNRRNAA